MDNDAGIFINIYWISQQNISKFYKWIIAQSELHMLWVNRAYQWFIIPARSREKLKQKSEPYFTGLHKSSRKTA